MEFMKDWAIIVPARLGSQRFPRKLLREVAGQPLVMCTADNIHRISPDIPLFFAVAEEELQKPLTEAGYTCIMTDPDLPSGTDRIAVANRKVGAKYVINVQADEPVIAADHIRQLKGLLEGGFDMATLATPFASDADFRDPNKVKAVRGLEQQALYFSRSPIPYDRDHQGELKAAAYWHLGLYGYTAELLEQFSKWEPSPLEKTERLEQLRVLENGGTIGLGITQTRTIGVDVPEDLEALEAYLGG